MSTKYRTTGKVGLFDTEKQRAKRLSIKNKYITLQANCNLVLTHLWLNCKKVKIRGAHK
jgi:hypothetical protein